MEGKGICFFSTTGFYFVGERYAYAPGREFKMLVLRSTGFC